MATSSAFSYAQAAKGHGAVHQAPNSSLPAQSSAQPQNDAAKEVGLLDASLDGSTDAPDTSDAPALDSQTNGLPTQRKESLPGTSESAWSDSASGRPAEPKRDEDAGRLEQPWRRSDKGTRDSSNTTRSLDDGEARKSRKGKKGKNGEKSPGKQAKDTTKETEAEPEPKIELSEAPIPSVNIWFQRKEAQLAKNQPEPDSAAELPNPGGLNQGEESQDLSDSTKVPAGSQQHGTATNGVKARRKSGDPLVAERNGSRGSRVAEKGEKNGKNEAPPPVEDDVSWPTPETAVHDQKKKPAERVERAEKESQDDGGPSKRPKEKWVHLPFTASASFQTPLPQLRSSKPRANTRAPNGARSGAGQYPSDGTGGTLPGKSGDSRERLRDSSNGANGPASSAPGGKRPSVDGGQSKPTAFINTDKAKPATPTPAGEHPQTHPRERGEGRGERGRGGFRGRGGHQSMNSFSQHQHTASSGTMPGYQLAGSFGPRGGGHRTYSPPRHGGHGQMYVASLPGGGRGRNGASKYHRMSLPVGRFPAMHQQVYAAYDMQMPPMAGAPFQAPQYWDSVVFNMLRSQIEYYFSIENLCKDMYLRRRMDSQGFVPLHFIAAFKRVRELSGEAGLSMVRAACEESAEIDYVVGEDDMERLRRRENWEQWLVRWEDRDEGARNNGPMHLTFKSRSYQYGAHFNEIPPLSYGVPSAPPSYPSQEEPHFLQFVGEAQYGHGPNGVPGGAGNGAPKQLSANVPDFAPSAPPTMGEPLRPSHEQRETLPAARYGIEDTLAAAVRPNGVHAAAQS